MEILGSYDARKGKGSVRLERDKIKRWIEKGAKTSATLHNILVSGGILSGKKINVLPSVKKKADAKEAKPAEAKEVPAAPETESAPL